QRHLSSFPTRRSSDLACLVEVVEVVDKPPVSFRFVEADSVDGFLEMDRVILVPDRCAAGIAALTDEHIAFGRRELLCFGVEKPRSEEHTSELQSRENI